jgi:hypothetical protein
MCGKKAPWIMNFLRNGFVHSMVSYVLCIYNVHWSLVCESWWKLIEKLLLKLRMNVLHLVPILPDVHASYLWLSLHPMLQVTSSIIPSCLSNITSPIDRLNSELHCWVIWQLELMLMLGSGGSRNVKQDGKRWAVACEPRYKIPFLARYLRR